MRLEVVVCVDQRRKYGFERHFRGETDWICWLPVRRKGRNWELTLRFITCFDLLDIPFYRELSSHFSVLDLGRNFSGIWNKNNSSEEKRIGCLFLKILIFRLDMIEEIKKGIITRKSFHKISYTWEIIKIKRRSTAWCDSLWKI